MSLEERVRLARPGGGVSAYLELAKPGITVFVAVTAAAAHVVAAAEIQWLDVAHVVLGTALSTAGALALNQYLERRPDALMLRTRDRPVPSGRVSPRRAQLFGVALAAAGTGHLAFWLGWAPALAAAAAAVLYNGVYTPLKLRSPVATPVGAIPGALPALIGWTASAGGVDARALALFGILFFWQLIHVLALGWTLREDYERAGFHLIPPVSPRLISVFLVGYAAALLVASTAPAFLGMAGGPYFAGALLLGAAMLAASAAFLAKPTRLRCRRVFVGSLLYHPLLLALMVAGALT